MYCVIPAAGRGVRFNELGKHYPKCVLPYKEIPIIVHNIKLALEAGAREVCIVVGHQADKIREIVGMYFPNDDRIHFADYMEVDGKGGPGVSIYCGTARAANEPILVLLSDIVINSTIPIPDVSWISTQRVDDWERWCMAETNNDRIVAFHDKPKDQPPTNRAVSGIYYFTNGKLFEDCLSKAIEDTTEGEVQISYAMNHYMQYEPLKTIDIVITDFGTLQEYLQNRGISNSRDFNDVYPIKHSLIIKKSEKNPEKIHAEVNWYENLPTHIKMLTPRIFDRDLYDDVPSYTMERIDSPTLRELYLYLESDPMFWKNVYNKLFDLVEDFSQYTKPGTPKFFGNLDKKNRERVALLDFDTADAEYFCDVFTGLDMGNEFDVFDDSIFHGDLCFSNIFYHPGSKQMKLIDPRGDAYGNVLYDLAKITHSAYYPYDYIDAELYLNKNGETFFFDAGKQKAREAYKKLFIERFDEDIWNKTLFLTASLFLTMIPLHTHSKINQRLFYEIFRKAATESGFMGTFPRR